MTTYLGEKGYTIVKDSITVKEQLFIREKLTVAPYVPNSPTPSTPYPVYRESAKKFYLPRNFGIEHFGVPNEIKIKNGDDINLRFNGDMRDYQKNIVNVYLNTIEDGNSGGLLEVPCGRGKTVIALNIISMLKKKTLIIVHKSFLLNQWIERIETFLPDARVGKIQGQIVDIKDKDIVIGMLQSLSMKDYHKDDFNSFGLTVVDECHHIGAEVFIRSLFKIVTPYTLGLSATMNRKDGLSYLFKMFLGEVIYKEKREGTDNVIVRGIQYNNDDEEYSEVKFDYRGNPQYSTMISKLCNFNRRSEFILQVLKDLLEENKNQQIMILAHNKSLLTYFHSAIISKNIADVGYYIGGMKEKQLKESETKKVILATYAMAAEALDIKTLTTLIMATPKTDVTQSIGRILRSKDHDPLVIDIIDQHCVFQKQWYKRRAFYKKEKYEVWFSHSENYKSTDTNWQILPIGNKKSKTNKSQDDLNSEDYDKNNNVINLTGKCLLPFNKF